MPNLLTFFVKDATTIRDDGLRTIKNGLIRRGIANPNVGPGSDWFIEWTALGNELAVIGANAVIKADQLMPDSADDADLDRAAAVFNLTKQPAAGALGNVVITASATTTITTGTQLTDAAGLRYAVLIGGGYANGASVPIAALDVGFATNHAPGDTLTWSSAPPYCDDKVAVDVAGLVNGIDAETSEVLRTRLFAILQSPPGAGNWQHFASASEASTPSVQKAFVYPAALGPSTVRVAVAAAPTTSSKSRDVVATTVSGVVDPYVKGQMPEHAYILTTTVTNVASDVAIGLSLPEAATANPPGPGGGWTNGTPWPAPDNVTTFRCTVTAVVSSNVFTVDAQTAPTPGVTRIAWFSPLEWKLYTALVASVSGTAGAYQVTVDRAFVGVSVGCYISPEALNSAAYFASLLAQFAVMGPGEVTTNASALVRGFRHPTPALSWPNTLGPHLLNRITSDSRETLAAGFLYRTDGTQIATGAANAVAPLVPATANLPPRIFTPRHLGLYRLP